MADAFREDAFAEHLLGFAHLDAVFVDLVYHGDYFVTMVGIVVYRMPSVTFFGVVYSAEFVVFYCFDELPHSEFHVVKVRNGLSQWLLQI